MPFVILEQASTAQQTQLTALHAQSIMALLMDLVLRAQQVNMDQEALQVARTVIKDVPIALPQPLEIKPQPIKPHVSTAALTIDCSMVPAPSAQ